MNFSGVELYLAFLGRRKALALEYITWGKDILGQTGIEHSHSGSTFGRGYIASPRTKGLAGARKSLLSAGDRSACGGQKTWLLLLTMLHHRFLAPCRHGTAYLGQKSSDMMKRGSNLAENVSPHSPGSIKILSLESQSSTKEQTQGSSAVRDTDYPGYSVRAS